MLIFIPFKLFLLVVDFSRTLVFLNMCFCYILYSPSSNKFYTGITQESVEERLVKHNTKAYGNHRFTAKVSDWELYLGIKAESISHARKMEVFIKRMKSQVFIRKLKDVPGNLQFLINKTKM